MRIERVEVEFICDASNLEIPGCTTLDLTRFEAPDGCERRVVEAPPEWVVVRHQNGNEYFCSPKCAAARLARVAEGSR